VYIYVYVYVHFAAGVQQDAHEILRSLTANMHLADLWVGESPHPHIQQHTNMLDGIFGGLLRSRVRCGLCLTDSVRYDTFLDLSLLENSPDFALYAVVIHVERQS